MMKRKNVKAIAGVMAAALMVAAVPVEADATTLGEGEYAREGEVEVAYTNEDILEDPAVPGVVVKIPANINFTEEAREVNTDVALESISEDYDVTKYEREVTISVKSENGYKLKKDGSADELKYQLFYDKDDTGSSSALAEAIDTEENIGVLGGYDSTADSSTARVLISGKAVLGADQTPSSVGKYTDKLTYKVVFNDAESAGSQTEGE